ncbi:uncharacterized protein F5Z01DRAFT_484132 [Emericellopsis atlantica]|uniref:EKC/KEOPS complex subunit GON7 n=1 Tax=Emericellopsis atlantica TaxID=2614577 RepID=A0A9P8CTD5_9HYPO|nr:uncharacterized protein F5Z01DRAFT_484132 [Emericellopsis atlantica]KAG9256711.1 hypothetical protein F5Z01DRAFT_484132 [Emericellopsis atlantica]
MSQDSKIALKATYASAVSTPFTVSKPLPTPSSSATADKTQYLQSLREALASTQAEINTELTKRMEEDNGRAGGKSAAEVKEEENYGEEVVEEED